MRQAVTGYIVSLLYTRMLEISKVIPVLVWRFQAWLEPILIIPVPFGLAMISRWRKPKKTRR